jgi:antitoxin component HigA of HigAB toxin-antitoxin module
MNELEYEQALKRIEELMDAEPDSPEEEELVMLSEKVERYEDTCWDDSMAYEDAEEVEE